MDVLATSGLTWSTLGKLVVGAMVAGVGVTAAFSALIYCADRAIELRSGERTTAAWLLSAAGGLAAVICAGLVVFGLILVVSKTK